MVTGITPDLVLSRLSPFKAFAPQSSAGASAKDNDRDRGCLPRLPSCGVALPHFPSAHLASGPSLCSGLPALSSTVPSRSGVSSPGLPVIGSAGPARCRAGALPGTDSMSGISQREYTRWARYRRDPGSPSAPRAAGSAGRIWHHGPSSGASGSPARARNRKRAGADRIRDPSRR